MTKKKAKSWYRIQVTENGTFSLSGTLGGKRHRERFKSEAEARAYAQRVEIEQLNEEQHGGMVWTRLSADQVKDATSALAMLDQHESSRTLTYAVSFFLKHYHEASNARLLSSAIRDYTDLRSDDEQNGTITLRQFRSIKIEMKRLFSCFGDVEVSEITTSQVEGFLKTSFTGPGQSSDKTWNNRRGLLNTFFEFCLKQKFVGVNPITGIPTRRGKRSRGTADTLTADRARELMSFLEFYAGVPGKFTCSPGAMVPFFALTLFAGIRPDWGHGEISKVQASDIHSDTGVIRIEPETSKVNELRSVKIQPNLALWLESYPIDDFPIVEIKRFRDLRMDIRKRFDLTHNVLRHTFVAMTVGAFRSVGDAAIQAGDSESIVRRHYLDLKSEAEADQFWRIVPAGTELPKQFEKHDGRFVFPKDLQ